MLRIVREVSSRRYYGVITDTPTWKVIIPTQYEQIIPHKYGLSCKKPRENLWDAYSLEGTPLFRECHNIMFLQNNYILFSSVTGECFIVNINTKHAIANMSFESILVFIGSSKQAVEFDANTDVFNLCLKTDYTINGAHIENCICAKTKNGWGVIDVNTNKIKIPFVHKTIKQTIGNNISVIDS